MIGKVVIVDSPRDGLREYVCLRYQKWQSGIDQLMVVDASSPMLAYRPEHIPNTYIVATLDMPEALLNLMFGLAKSLVMNNVLTTEVFRQKAVDTLKLMRAAYENVSPCRWDNFEGYAVEALGRHNVYEKLVVLEDDGHQMAAVNDAGNIISVVKSHWLFGNTADGLSELKKLCQRFPDNHLLEAHHNYWKGQLN